MKYLALLLVLTLSACVTTKTTNPDGSVTSTSRPDPKVIKELEPVVQEFGAGVTEGALNFLKSQQQ